MARCSGCPVDAVEGHDGLALVGDADGGDRVARRSARRPPTSARVARDGVPDLGGVVLDPAGAGEVLGQLPVGDVDDPGLLVDGQGAHPGRARIDGDDDLAMGSSTLTLAAIRRRWGRPGRPSRANHRERPVTCTDGARIWLTRA